MTWRKKCDDLWLPGVESFPMVIHHEWFCSNNFQTLLYLKYLNLFVRVSCPIAAKQSIWDFKFDLKTIVYSFSECFFKNNVKLNAYPIDNNRGVYSTKPDWQFSTRTLSCFSKMIKTDENSHDLGHKMTKTSYRDRSSPNRGQIWTQHV